MKELVSRPIKRTPLGWHCEDLFKIKRGDRDIFGRPTSLTISSEGEEWEVTRGDHRSKWRVTLIKSPTETVTVLTPYGETVACSILFRGCTIFDLGQKTHTLDGAFAVSFMASWKESEADSGIDYHVTIHDAGSPLLAAVAYLNLTGRLVNL